MPDNDVVILSAVRTAQGRFQGGFAATPAQELGAIAIKEALDRAERRRRRRSTKSSSATSSRPASARTWPARSMLKAGLPVETSRRSPSTASASRAPPRWPWAAAAIKAGDGDLYVVGGTENMTRAPWLLQNGRTRLPHGHAVGDKMFDAMVLDGLWCAIDNAHMGLTAENLSEQFDISKEEQNEVAFNSQAKAAAADQVAAASRTRSSRSRSRSARATPRSSTPTSARARPRPRRWPVSSRSSRRTAW